MTKTLFTVSIDVLADPPGMSFALSHTGRLTIDELEAVANVLDDLVDIAGDHFARMTPEPAKPAKTFQGPVRPTVEIIMPDDATEPAPVQGKTK